MGRIKLELPKHYSFFTPIAVRITDLNYGGHVGNDTILTLLHEARVRFLKHHGFSELEFAGVSLIMGDVAIEFKNELFYGDELKAYVTAYDFSRAGFDLAYKLVKNEAETVVALAKTGMVCFDYNKRKVVGVPATAVEQLGRVELKS
jgi:YbgC/YbaW family acyl-CoA thioester hydrolase